MPTSVQVTTLLVVGRPPKTAPPLRTPRFPSRTHSTHCWPTAAERRQSGHAGRPHRTQETYVSRPGCLKQVGMLVLGLASGPGGAATAVLLSLLIPRGPGGARSRRTRGRRPARDDRYGPSSPY